MRKAFLKSLCEAGGCREVGKGCGWSTEEGGEAVVGCQFEPHEFNSCSAKVLS